MSAWVGFGVAVVSHAVLFTLLGVSAWCHNTLGVGVAVGFWLGNVGLVVLKTREDLRAQKTIASPPPMAHFVGVASVEDHEHDLVDGRCVLCGAWVGP
jgi:hypothetical protein